MTLLHYYLFRCSSIITDSYTVPGNVALRLWIFLHPGKLGSGLLFSFLHVYQEKGPNVMLWNVSRLKPLVLPQAQDDLVANYGVYIVQDQFVKRRNSEDCRRATWISESFFTETRESEARRGFQRLRGGSWKSLEDLRFWKVMNELSISTYADFM